MIDRELCNEKNFVGKIIEFSSKEFTDEIKRITKENNITQELLFARVEEETGFSESKIKRWKSGKMEPIQWDDIEKFCAATGAKPENFMTSKYQDKIYCKYMEAREVAKNGVVSDEDKYCLYLESLCSILNLIDSQLTNINIHYESTFEQIKKLKELSNQKRNKRIQDEKEKERKNMEAKIRDEQNKRIEAENKYKEVFDKYAFLGGGKIKYSILLLNILTLVCSVVLLGVDNKFNIGFSIVILVMSVLFILSRMFLKVDVKRIYYDEFEKHDNNFTLFFLGFPTITLLTIVTNDFNNSFCLLNPFIDGIFIVLLLLMEISFLKNIERISKK